MRALALVARALGPRRSHSTSRRALLASDCSRAPWFSRKASRAVDAQATLGIDRRQLDGAGGHVFEKEPIVADDHESERRAGQKPLQPEDGTQVQMVGRLVQKQHVRPGGQGPGDGQAFAPAAGKRRDRHGRIVKTQTPQRHGHPADGFRLAEAPRSLGHGPGHDGFRRGPFVETVFLGHVGQPHALAQGTIAGIGRDQPGHDFEQRGFAGAVGADEADALLLRDCQGNVREKRPDAIGLGYGAQGYACTHGAWLSGCRAGRQMRRGRALRQSFDDRRCRKSGGKGLRRQRSPVF